MSETKASQRDGDETVTRKFIGNRVTDGSIQIPDDDTTAQHEGMWRNMEMPKAQLEAHLQKMALPELKRLAVRQRNRLAGTHESLPVNSTSREVTLNSVSRLAACRLFISGLYPRLSRTSALFNECVAYALMSPEQQEAYEQAHPEKFTA